MSSSCLVIENMQFEETSCSPPLLLDFWFCVVRSRIIHEAGVWWGWSIRARASIGARTARWKKKFYRKKFQKGFQNSRKRSNFNQNARNYVCGWGCTPDPVVEGSYRPHGPSVIRGGGSIQFCWQSNSRRSRACFCSSGRFSQPGFCCPGQLWFFVCFVSVLRPICFRWQPVHASNEKGTARTYAAGLYTC